MQVFLEYLGKGGRGQASILENEMSNISFAVQHYLNKFGKVSGCVFVHNGDLLNLRSIVVHIC